MKAYFINLFKYDRFANELVLEALMNSTRPQKAVQQMAHLLAAQLVWLRRCLAIPQGDLTPWPNWQPDGFTAIMQENNEGWLKYLRDIPEDDLEKVIHYKNSQGNSYSDKAIDIITHVINHSTHTRAQVGQQLKFAGLEKLPLTDYIFYVRD
ncbi:hypothetical protein BH09BAC6_BH09BAC6_15160 [soil metagenome]|jgi:uncharacterized damage-inducible protein DinB